MACYLEYVTIRVIFFAKPGFIEHPYQAEKPFTSEACPLKKRDRREASK